MCVRSCVCMCVRSCVYVCKCVSVSACAHVCTVIHGKFTSGGDLAKSLSPESVSDYFYDYYYYHHHHHHPVMCRLYRSKHAHVIAS